jgi:oligopeptide/dipeptide ABC transporter ATP-binding protein
MADILRIDHLRVAFQSQGRLVEAVADASISVPEGGAVGLVGESGSGKSTLARALMGLLATQPALLDARRYAVAGTAVDITDPAALRRLRGGTLAMVFQDPLSYLNPLMRAGRQIEESIRLHDKTANRAVRLGELLELVRLAPGVARAYPHELSGGMRQRVLLAIALACRPRLLLADEPTTALDLTTQMEILALLRDVRRELGMALLLISHDLGSVAELCDQVTVMYGGRTIETGSRRAIFGEPSHPYTRGLLDAARARRDATGHFVTLGGSWSASDAPVVGCAFAPRCADRFDRCREQAPSMLPTEADPSHQARCWQLEPAT